MRDQLAPLILQAKIELDLGGKKIVKLGMKTPTDSARERKISL